MSVYGDPLQLIPDVICAISLVLEDPAGLVLGAERGVARVLAGAGHARVGQRALRVRRAAHRGGACNHKQTADRSKQTADKK